MLYVFRALNGIRYGKQRQLIILLAATLVRELRLLIDKGSNYCVLGHHMVYPYIYLYLLWLKHGSARMFGDRRLETATYTDASQLLVSQTLKISSLSGIMMQVSHHTGCLTSHQYLLRFSQVCSLVTYSLP